MPTLIHLRWSWWYGEVDMEVDEEVDNEMDRELDMDMDAYLPYIAFWIAPLLSQLHSVYDW